jgi:hypothetical protein
MAAQQNLGEPERILTAFADKCNCDFYQRVPALN